MSLAPPEEGLYPSWPECEQMVQAHAARSGYAVVPHAKVKSKKTGQYARYVIRCAKSGVLQSKVPEELRRTTKKTGCPFSATANVRDDGSGCYLRVQNPTHNHPPAASPSEHAQHRRLTEDQRRIIEAGAIQKKPVRALFDDLRRAYPDCYARLEDIGNYIQAWKRRARENATGVQALLYRLQERDDIWSFPLTRNGTLEGMFWVPKWSQDMWTRDPDVLIMQTAHIANKPVLPVLEMNSVVAFGSRLGAGYAILPDKNDPTLLWLVQAVDRLRQRLKIAKPAFITVTDFQTAEKNIIAEVHRSGPQHRATQIIFGRVLDKGDTAAAAPENQSSSDAQEEDEDDVAQLVGAAGDSGVMMGAHDGDSMFM